MPYIILDRDGVINYDSDAYIKSPEEWLPIPGSLEAIADLNRAGFRVLIATNQSGVARGLYDVATLDMIHEKMQLELSKVGGFIDAIYFCPHHPNDNCLCRKPKPGLLTAMQEKFQFNFSETFFVGDKWTDVETAIRVGCKPILIRGKKVVDLTAVMQNIPQFPDLKQAVQYVMS